MTLAVNLRDWAEDRDGHEFPVYTTKDGALGPIQFSAVVRADSEAAAQAAMNAKASMVYQAMIARRPAAVIDHDVAALPSLVDVEARLAEVEARLDRVFTVLDAVTQAIIAVYPPGHPVGSNMRTVRAALDFPAGQS